MHQEIGKIALGRNDLFRGLPPDPVSSKQNKLGDGPPHQQRGAAGGGGAPCAPRLRQSRPRGGCMVRPPPNLRAAASGASLLPHPPQGASPLSRLSGRAPPPAATTHTHATDAPTAGSSSLRPRAPPLLPTAAACHGPACRRSNNGKQLASAPLAAV
jgi:hypothetical protein